MARELKRRAKSHTFRLTAFSRGGTAVKLSTVVVVTDPRKGSELDQLQNACDAMRREVVEIRTERIDD